MHKTQSPISRALDNRNQYLMPGREPGHRLVNGRGPFRQRPPLWQFRLLWPLR